MMKRYNRTSNRVKALLESRVQRYQHIDRLLPVLVQKFTLSDTLFRHTVTQNRFIDTILPVLDSSVSPVVSSTHLHTPGASRRSWTIIPSILAAGIIYGVLKRIELPSIDSLRIPFTIPSVHEIITEKITDIRTQINSARFPEIDIVDEPDTGDSEIHLETTEESIDRSIYQEILDRIYSAKLTVESIHESVKINFHRVSESISLLTSFVTAGPFGAINILFGKRLNTTPIRQAVDSYVSVFWDSTSSYIRDLFKWIQLKDIVDPVSGLVSGFTGFITNTYSTFIKSFTGSDNTLERETTYSSTLLATASIFSRLTSTLVKFIPVIPVGNAGFTVARTVDTLKKTITQDEYETIEETVEVSTGKIWIMGDSIAVGYKKQKGFAGTPVSGQNPSKILSTQVPEFLKANSTGTYKTVVLSSGISNAPYKAGSSNQSTKQALNVVDTILSRLSSVNVILFGVSNIKHEFSNQYGKFVHDGPWLNEELSKLAAKYSNVTFTGPIPGNATSSDKIHATNYNWVGNLEENKVVTRKVSKRVKKSNSTDTSKPGSSTGINSSVVPGTAQSAAMNKAIRWIIANSKGVIVRPGYAQKGKVGECAKWVRMAIQHGGIPLKSGTVSACDYHNHGTLRKAGFVLVGQGNHSTSRRAPPGLKTGDVIVTQRITGHKHGHISITINEFGEQATDYLQKNLFDSAKAYGHARAPYYVYRYVGQTQAKSTQQSTTAQKSPGKSSSKTGIGGLDYKPENVTVKIPESTTGSIPLTTYTSSKPKESGYSSTNSVHREDFVAQLYTLAGTSKTLRVLDDTREVILRLSSTTATTVHKNPPDILLSSNTRPKQPISASLPSNTFEYLEIPGPHPLDILFSSELSGTINTVI